MKKILFVAAIAVLLTGRVFGQPLSLTQDVNPMIGTAPNPFVHIGLGADPGSVFPGAVFPNGMVAWSPDTPLSYKVAGGYAYEDSTIIDFSLTHFSGRGVVCLKDICFMPLLQRVMASPVSSWNSFAASFSHSNENASPGYYRVTFDNGIQTELTATARTGMARFTFPANSTATILLKADGSISVNGNEVAGYRNTTIGGGKRSYTVYFAAQFDHPFGSVSTWTGLKSSNNSSAEGDSCGTILAFNTSVDSVVLVKVGISYVSVENARANARIENTGWDFSALRQKADSTWNDVLNCIQVSGGKKEDRETFYTALYHCFIHPNLLDDVNGQYPGMDGKVHVVTPGHHQYQNIPAWDEHRSHAPLLAMLAPGISSDVDQSLVTYAQQDADIHPGGGGFPRWEQVNRNSGGMTGDGDCQIISSTYAFGATNFDAESALAVMDKGATQPGITSDGFAVRGGLEDYMSKGYLPLDISKTLEYCNDDFAIAQFAQARGDASKHYYFQRRAQNWENLFDSSIGYLRPRNEDGSWLEGFTPSTKTGCTEGTAAQYLWMVNFNLRSLIDKIGGDAKTITRLDHFFKKLDSGGKEETAFMGNEPNEGVPWTYDFTGAPWRTQEVVGRIRSELFTNMPNGLPGNDDAGSLSSWYVWSALGMYPEIPGSDVLVLGSPLFPKEVLHLKGGDVIIKANGADQFGPFVQSLKVNGKLWEKPWIRFSDIRKRGEIEYELGAAPDTSWGAEAQNSPPSYSSEIKNGAIRKVNSTAEESSVKLVVQTQVSGATIPDDFTGLSFGTISEMPDLRGRSSRFWSANNVQLVTLFKNSGIHHLRLGGSTVEGLKAAVPSDVDIDSVFAFAQAANIKVMYTLQLLNGTAATAASTAKYVWTHYRQYLDCFAIGNEPDIKRYHYPPYGTGTDPRITDYSSYLSLWRKFAKAILDSVPEAKFAGPDPGGKVWAPEFADDERNSGKIKIITQHFYVGGTPFIDGLSPRTIPKPPYIPVQEAIDNMLSEEWVMDKYPALYTSCVEPVLKIGFPYRLTESDDYLRGVPSASNAFVSALWALDYMYWWATHDCTGVNFHNTMWVHTDTIVKDSADNYQISPKAYAIKMFDLGSHGTIKFVAITNPDSINLTAYAVECSNGLYVTIINKEHGAHGHNADVSIAANGLSTEASVMFLTPPDGNLSATQGITLGGASISNSVLWQGKWTTLHDAESGAYLIKVPPASAALVKIDRTQ
ncbi:MAG TPA: GH92 family glycosyl hydrolase [Bacteroidota bacterium]|nr:GH92 family glycosyl hydrolase [Bacteroidota bacterium]